MSRQRSAIGPHFTNALGTAFLKLVRFYTYHTPIRKGRLSLMFLALGLVKSRPPAFLQKVPDGRVFEIDLKTRMQESVYFLGEYEPFITEIAGRLIFEGDVCIDAGANFGWYTTLMAVKAGPSGTVHAFEPVPSIFAELEANAGLLAGPVAEVYLNKLALTDAESEATINVFSGQPSGHASLANKAGGSAYICKTIPLDKYLSQNVGADVNFVKIDVEGAELLLLRGSERVLGQTVPPILVVEMALNQAEHFGYVPNDLIEFISSKADYRFFTMDEIGWRLIPINGFEPSDVGANVLCVPARVSQRVQSVVREYID